MERENREFGQWLKGEKFPIVLAISCAVLPVILESSEKIFDNSKLAIYIKNYQHLLEYGYNFCNIIFIVISIFVLSNNDFLLDAEGGDKAKRLFKYVKDKFGSNSALHSEGESDLFQRMSKSFKQFYYSWLAVWLIWLILYIGKLIYLFRIDQSSNSTCLIDSSKYQYLFENTFNLINSCVIFFLYLVITISTVKQTIPGHNLKEMNRYIIIILFVALGCFILDCNTLFLNDNQQYYKWQFIIQMIISFIACISMMAVLGRLNSSFLDIPQWLILCLYFYAALQMFYPLGALSQYLHEKFHSKLSIDSFDIIIKYTYFAAFFGKICLLLTVKWIMTKKRFLFYLLHNAQILAESDDMLKEFNRYYNKFR